MSLYRTYRPTTFADVVGQDHIVSTLENAVTQEKVSHAYLFAGPRGTGKTSVARILAKAMLTKGMTDATLRGHVEVAVQDGSLVDLVEIDAATNTQVDNIRDLIEKIQFSPVAAMAKVYIIDEVHMLSKGAFNALLKTLEEPPSYAYFILATTELHKIPATIQSRCQRFLFHPVAEEDIIRRLQYIADQEHITVDRTALRTVARHAEGGMRDAITLLDQLRTLPKITVEDVHERIGETGSDYVERIFTAMGAGDRGLLLKEVLTMETAGVPLETVTRLLLTEARVRLHQSVDANESTAVHERRLNAFLRALRDMRVAPVPGLILESVLISLCGDEQPNAEDKPAPRKKVVVKAADPPTPTIERPTAAPLASAQATESEKPAAVIEVPNVSMESLRDAWPEIVKAVTPPSIKMSLKNGHIESVKDTTVTVAFASTFHRDKVAKIDAARAVEAVLEKVFRRQFTLKCVLEQEEHGKTTADKEMVNVAEAAAEVF